MDPEVFTIETTFLRELQEAIAKYGGDSTNPLVCFIKEWAVILLKDFAREKEHIETYKIYVKETDYLCNVIYATATLMIPRGTLQEKLILIAGTKREREKNARIARYLGWGDDLPEDI